MQKYFRFLLCGCFMYNYWETAKIQVCVRRYGQSA